jgi:hypothetical protein
MGWHSDKTKERRWHTALAMMTTSLGLLSRSGGQPHCACGIDVPLQRRGRLAIFPVFGLCRRAFNGYGGGSLIGLSTSAIWVGLLSLCGGHLSKKTGSYLGGVLYLSCICAARFDVDSCHARLREERYLKQTKVHLTRL